MADAIVKLNLMAPGYWTPPVPDGWSESTGVTGFVYQFTGGNAKNADGSDKNDGSLQFEHGQGPKTIEVQLITADGGSRYYITAIGISYDDGTKPHDLTPPDLAGAPARSCIVMDSDVNPEKGYFNVTCSFDGHDGIVCDPRWENE